ncbi:MAG: homoserine kinase [Actinobacteria bacterium]|nr:homoserine kinase [Actinomycetota bacterium]
MARARVPASSANLGPGFDTLAVALSLYVEVEVAEADELCVRSHGEGADLPAGPQHLAARVARAVTGHDHLAITVRSDIPVGRGLGSSAALAAATAAAAGAADPLAVAAATDGHAENAAASVVGGLVSASIVSGRPVVTPMPLDEAITFVVLVPHRPLPTAEARAALPAEVPHRDAAFNLGRMGLLLGGLADHRRLVADATQDRLHQMQRAPLFPESPGLMAGLVEAGALASCWSGAGPSLLAVCTSATAGAVAEAGARLLADRSVDGRVLRLEPDRRGLVVD